MKWTFKANDRKKTVQLFRLGMHEREELIWTIYLANKSSVQLRLKIG